MALLLQSSSIFSNSCLNDNIRQTFLDLKARASEVVNEEEKDSYFELTRNNIAEFLNESQEYLAKDLSVSTAEELFATISLCYTSFQEYSLPLINDFVQKSRSNSNYIIVFASILGELKKSQPELFNQDYYTFVNDCLKEILPQIQKSSTNLVIFNHQIAQQFCNDLIINLLISADLTKELFLNFFPIILSHNIYLKDPKYVSLLQILIKNNFAKILPLNEKSKSEIYEFLTTNNEENISKMSQEAFLLIFGAIIYSETDGETVIDGLDEDSILPFLALLTFIDSNNEFITLVKQDELLDMLYEKVRKLKFNENPIFNISLKIIINRRSSLSVAFGDGNENEYLKKIEVLLLQKAITENEFFIEKVEFFKWFFSTVLVNIQSYDEKINVNDYTLFLLSNRNEISKNLFPAYNRRILNNNINLECVFQFIENNFKTPDIIDQVFYLLNNYMYMSHNSESVRNQFKSIYYQELNEKNWKDFILIGLFLNCNYYKDDFYDEKIPDHIQYLLYFKENLNEMDLDIDIIIEMIFLVPDLILKYDQKLFDLLFKAILKDKKIRQIYFNYLVCNKIQNGQKVEELIQLLSNYKDYQYDLTDAIVRNFYYDEGKNILIKRIDVSLSSFPIPKFGQSIVEKFYSLIEKNQETFQSFLCLKSIARSFPFLFTNDDKRIFNMVLPFLDNISYIYSDKKVEKMELIIYTTFSAISFLFSALQAPFMLDKFVVFVIENIKSFTNWQVVCFISIFCVLINDQSLYLSFIPILLKYNFIEKIINLLEKDFQNESLLIEYRTNIYYFLILFFISLSKISEREKVAEVIMINEIMKVENPFNYVFDYLFSTSPCFVNMNNDQNNSIYRRLLRNDNDYKTLLDSFMKIDIIIGFPLMNDNSDFYDENSKEFIIFKNNLIEIMNKTKIIDYSLPNELSKLTIKMVCYLSTKKSFIFRNYLNSEKTELNQFLYDELLKTGKDLKKMENEAIEHPEEKDNRDIESIDVDEFLINCDIKQSILKILVNQLMQKKTYNFCVFIYTAIWSICMTKTGKKVFPFLFDTIDQFLNEDCYDNLNILKIVELFKILIKIEEFKSVFIDSKSCENLINVVLLPKTRIYDKILIETAELFDSYETNLPIRISQLIGFLFQYEKKQNIIPLIFSLISKFDQKQIENIYYIIMNNFEKEISKGEINDTIIQYYKYSKEISEGRKYDLILLLEKAFENIGNDYQLLKNIGIILTILAPTKGTLSSNSSKKNNYSYKSSIPSYIRETSPEFWDLFDKHKEIILSSIDNDPLLLNQFNFLLDYPELISIKSRIIFFIDKIRKNVKGNLVLYIDRENILESSFNQLKEISSDQLLNNIRIKFIDEIVDDLGGARREWFTLLTKEIFNQKNGLFKCYENNTYQPNPRSSIQPNHLEYFYFAGRIIARLIVDGQCIESHLTRSFYRFILYGKTKFEDLEEIDSNLYSSLKWMINNDVSQLCKVFAIDIDEFDTHKVVELKENGEKIEVNNENKEEYIDLHSKYILRDQIHQQLEAFINGFDSIIDSKSIEIFNINELDLVLCGIPIIDVEDFKANTTFGDPYTADSPVIKMFFNVISKWKNEDLAKLLMFMTGSSRVPANGFKEFCEMTHPLKIDYGGDRSLWPQSHTCFNILHLPQYESEEEMNEKLLYAIQYCDSFGLH